MSRYHFLLTLLGLASLLPYVAAYGLGDLRKNTAGFEIAFFAAFALYLAAVAVVLRHRSDTHSALRNTLLLITFFSLLFHLILLPTRPTLSDDMYRYVWDGRVQANGLSPYRYPPKAPQLAALRRGDAAVYRYINRKDFITVYPPGAQMAYAAVWRIVGDSVTGFKLMFVLAELLGAVILLALLRAFHQPPERIVIYLWSPLLVFEVAHAGHVDAIMLPLLIAAFWARVKERPVLLGICFGAATLVKLFPLVLLPALLPVPTVFSWKGLRAPLQMAAAFAGVIGLGYLPYVLWGAGALGFLPLYFNENFNLGLARVLFDLAPFVGLAPAALANAVTFGGLIGLSAVFVLRPAASGREALVRCVWLIGWFTLFTQNLFPWYLLWLLPLMALFAEPGRLLGFKLAPLTAWLIFSGTIALAYMFFIRWRVMPWAQAAEYGPLYGVLLISALRFLPQPRPGLRPSQRERGVGPDISETSPFPRRGLQPRSEVERGGPG